MKTIRGEQGFTLMEIMVSVGIFSIVSAMLFIAFIQSTEYYNKGQRKAAVIQQARNSMELMSRNIREASSISVASTNTITYVQYDYDSDSNNADDTVKYSVEANGGVNRIRKDVNSAFKRHLTDTVVNVNSLTFEYFSTDTNLDTNSDGLADGTEIDTWGNGDSTLNGTELGKINYVKINLTVDKTAMGETSSTDLVTSVYLRNLR